MDLPLYLEDTNTSVAEFARLIGASRTTVYEWLSKKKSPSKKYLTKIRMVTGDRIQPNDFLLPLTNGENNSNRIGVPE